MLDCGEKVKVCCRLWGPIIDKLVIVSLIYFTSHHRIGIEIPLTVVTAQFQAITDKIRKLGSSKLSFIFVLKFYQVGRMSINQYKKQPVWYGPPFVYHCIV